MNRPAKDILITVPTRGAVQAETIMRLQYIRDRHPGIPPIQYVPGHLSTAETRNRIIQTFLAMSSKQVLVMVDDDTVPSGNFLDLCDSLGPGGGFDLIGQPYLLAMRPESYWPDTKFVPTGNNDKERELVYCAFDRVQKGLPIADGVEIRVADTHVAGVHEHYAVCSGAIAITRIALDDVVRMYGPRPWQFSYYNDQLVGSDITFCHMLQVLGSKIGVDWTEVADHQPVVSLEAIKEAIR